MKPAEIRRQIQSGTVGPLYLLEGEDRESRNELAGEFGALVDEGLHPFNVESFYANEATTTAGRDQLIGAILSAANDGTATRHHGSRSGAATVTP